MTRGDVFKFLVLRTVGNFLLFFAIFGVIATFGPALFYEAEYRLMQYRGVKYTVQVQASNKQTESSKPSNEIGEDQPGFMDSISGPRERVLIPKNTNFSIMIPKIGASAPITPNVDPSNSDEFLRVLQTSVAHSQGTVFPGMPGNIYLFAHSADNFWNVGRYNAVFYLIKDLQPGDEIVIFFENIRYNYEVYQSGIIDPNNVSFIVNAKNKERETLILQTCWPPGTPWKRAMILAKRKG